MELWRFFAPFPEGGDEPDYLFGGNRAVLGVHYDGPRWALRGAIQYVRVENLPRGAIGPGLLGNGGAYFFQAAGTFSYQFYLRALSAEFRAPSRGLSIEVGRLSFMPEPMAGPVDPAESLAQERLAGRLLGDMDGSLYERAWDGGRVQVRQGGWLWSAAAALPTQGTFEESANLPIDRLAVAALDVTAAPGALLERTRASRRSRSGIATPGTCTHAPTTATCPRPLWTWRSARSASRPPASIPRRAAPGI